MRRQLRSQAASEAEAIDHGAMPGGFLVGSKATLHEEIGGMKRRLSVRRWFVARSRRSARSCRAITAIRYSARKRFRQARDARRHKRSAVRTGRRQRTRITSAFDLSGTAARTSRRSERSRRRSAIFSQRRGAAGPVAMGMRKKAGSTSSTVARPTRTTGSERCCDRRSRERSLNSRPALRGERVG